MSGTKRQNFLKRHPELADEEWLTTHHVDKLFSIVEMSKLLTVTPATVRKSLRQYNIQSPSQQQLREASNNRKYGVPNPGQVTKFKEKARNTMNVKYGGHVFSAKNRWKRDETCKARYGNVVASKSDTIKDKIRNTTLRDNLSLMTDTSWLIHQHYTLNKSLTTISKEIDVSWATLQTYYKQADVATRQSSTIPNNIERLLKNSTWLYDQHITQRKSYKKISTELNVSEGTVQRYAARSDIHTTLHSTLPSSVHHKLDDPAWLHEQCIVQMKNYNQLADELSIAPSTVQHYCSKHKIVPSSINRKITNTILLKLENKEWVYDQHITKQKPLIQIATELGFCDNSPSNSGVLSKYTKQHNIPVRHFSHSVGEKQVLDIIRSMLPKNSTIIVNNKDITSPYELDIYLPDHKLAIEYNGLYWHSEQQGKHKWYHYNKWKLCNDNGIQLITIFEDEWIHKTEQVTQKLSSLLHKDTRDCVFARTCTTILVNKTTKKAFFDSNHIQGNGPGSINVGLEHNNELVACMSFIKQKAGVFYLNRYATSRKVPGGFSKLLSHFKKTNDWTKLISFADRRWSDGNLYRVTGWAVDNPLEPDYTYIKNHKRIHKFNYRRNKLPTILPSFDPALSEWENCKANKVLRVWDCGKAKFIMENK